MRLPTTEHKIVLIGGGSGSSVVLQGLKSHPVALTAIVTMFDSGGSSGLLREEFGYPPLGDLRQCLLALSDESEHDGVLRGMLNFRFRQESSLNGHNLGNLFLAALTTLRNDVEEAIEEMSRILRIRGQVIPVSLGQADLCANLEDGSVIRGETHIDLRGRPLPRISSVFLEPNVEANPRAVKAIMDADAVVLGPGDLYTSIIPNLLVRGIPEALAKTKAIRIYICNLMTKPGETDDFKASDFLQEIRRYLNGAELDWAVVNNQPIPEEIRQAYIPEAAYPVEPDQEAVQQYAAKYFGGPLANDQRPLRHDPARLAEALLCLIPCGRDTNGHVTSNGYQINRQVSENGAVSGHMVPPSASRPR